MKYKLRCILLVILVISCITGCSSSPYTYYEGKYTHAYISSLSAGIETKIRRLCLSYDIFYEDFLVMQALPYEELTPENQAIINAFRNELQKPEAGMVLSATVAQSEIDGYLASNRMPTGFITRASDSKKYDSYDDYYYGLRLEVNSSYSYNTDEYIGVFRFTLSDTSAISIPRSTDNGGTFNLPFPFTGHGFTAGIRETGCAIWYLPENDCTVTNELWAVYKDGTEKLLAYYDAAVGYYVWA